jgi:fucose permease
LSLLAVALVAFVMLGLVDGAIGVAWPSMRDVFERGVSDLGLLLAFGSVGYLTASVGYGWSHARLGTGFLLTCGAGLLGLGLLGIASAPSWLVVALSSVILGLGGGLLDTGMNAHAALAFDIRSINLLHASFGVGATLGPLAITISLTAGGAWRGGYVVLAGLQFISASLIWRRRDRWAGAEPDLSSEEPVTTRRLQVWLLLALFFLYTGVEVAIGQWAFTLLTEERGVETAVAGVWVAAYWGGLTVGRFGFGVIGGRLAASRILDASMLVALVGLGLLWVDPAGYGALGLPLAGLGLAAVFPTLVSLTPSRIGRARSTRSIGYQLAAANIGAASLPWAVGAVAEGNGLDTLVPSLFIGAVLLAIAHFVGDRF